ncbi:ADP-ribosyltransferase domain-containing protein, partial [Streptomyces sp. NPDC060022]|uniref:ADP-ribosyltransferase domain-containing protein n=1 Tax=Streptomyces sp. NPDC060022 TaxID=3347039 RepID=UPI0036B975CA
MPDTIQAELAMAVSGQGLPTRLEGRLKAAVEWLETYGDAAREAVRALRPAHLTALFLYSDADFKLFKVHTDASRFGDAAERLMLRYKIRKIARARDRWAPLLLTHDARFQTLLGAVADLYQERTPELELRVDRLLRDITDGLHQQLPVHISMAAEALELLPPVNATVHWGGWMSGKDSELAADDPKVSQDTMFMPRFRSTSFDRAVAVAFMESPKNNTHAVLVSVENSTAPLISPFSQAPHQREVLYGPGAAFQITGREPQRDWISGASYVTYSLREMPSRPDPVYYNASGLSGGDGGAGERVGAVEVSPYKRMLQQVGFHALSVTPVVLG